MTAPVDPMLLPLLEVMARAAFEAMKKPATLPQQQPAPPAVGESQRAA